MITSRGAVHKRCHESLYKADIIFITNWPLTYCKRNIFFNSLESDIKGGSNREMNKKKIVTKMMDQNLPSYVRQCYCPLSFLDPSRKKWGRIIETAVQKVAGC